MKDIYDDTIEVELEHDSAGSEIYLTVHDSQCESDDYSVAALTPPLARKLARKLLKAADKAEISGA